MRYLITLFCGMIFLILVLAYIDPSSSIVIVKLEYAYMEGQKDALEGDIRIKEVEGDWKYIKSPWDNGDKAIYVYHSQYLTEVRGE